MGATFSFFRHAPHLTTTYLPFLLSIQQSSFCTGGGFPAMTA